MNTTSFEGKGEGMSCLAGHRYTARAMAVIFEELLEGLSICMSEEGSGETDCAEKSAQ